MDQQFTGVVSKFIDKNGEKDGKPYISWQAVIEEQAAQYPDSIVIDGFGEKCKIPKEGQEVCVFYHPKAKEWNGKYFGSNNAWRVDILSEAKDDDNAPVTGNQSAGESKASDLPF